MTRQRDFLEWAIRMFGPIASHRRERAARFVEEAVELGQAAGLTEQEVAALVTRTFGRPPGDMRKELGQAAATLGMFAENENMSAEVEAQREWERVRDTSPEQWRKRHDEKVAAGIANIA